MTNLKVSIKLEAKGVSAMKKAAIVKGTEFLETNDMWLVYGACRTLEGRLNDYERACMASRSADPILGHINTARWSVSFDFYMRRRDALYGKFNIVNNQPDVPYFYTGSYTTKKGVTKTWVASGTVINLAKVRYSTSKGMVYPLSAVALMFYSHKDGMIIWRNYRRYDTGGHTRYKRIIDALISDTLGELPEHISPYISRSIK